PQPCFTCSTAAAAADTLLHGKLKPWVTGLWLRGIPEAINFALSNLVYKPIPDDNSQMSGVREVVFLLSNTTDSGAAALLTSTVSTKIRLNPVSDPVVLQGPARTCGVEDQVLVTFEGVNSSVDGLRIHD